MILYLSSINYWVEVHFSSWQQHYSRHYDMQKYLINKKLKRFPIPKSKGRILVYLGGSENVDQGTFGTVISNEDMKFFELSYQYCYNQYYNTSNCSECYSVLSGLITLDHLQRFPSIQQPFLII